MVDYTPVIKAFGDAIRKRIKQLFESVVDDLFLEMLRESDLDVVRRAMKSEVGRGRYVFRVGGFLFHREGFGRTGILKKMAEASEER